MIAELARRVPITFLQEQTMHRACLASGAARFSLCTGGARFILELADGTEIHVNSADEILRALTRLNLIS